MKRLSYFGRERGKKQRYALSSTPIEDVVPELVQFLVTAWEPVKSTSSPYVDIDRLYSQYTKVHRDGFLLRSTLVYIISLV